MVSTRVMTEPKDLQVGQSRQMGHFLQVANLVLPDVDLLQLCAVGEVLKRADFVVRQRHKLSISKRHRLTFLSCDTSFDFSLCFEAIISRVSGF